MIKLYEELIEGIPGSVTARDVFVGLHWTAVLAEGNLGIAMTTPGVSRPFRDISPWNGRPLRDLARLCLSWNMTEASVGMAAVNAWYNSAEKMEVAGFTQGNCEYCTFGLDLAGKKAAMVGHLHMPEDAFADASELIILERNPQPGDYPDSACEYLLPSCDVIVITGNTFTNKTLMRLLELGKDACVILAGPSVPMSAALLRYGIDRAAGLVITDAEKGLALIRSGVRSYPYDMGVRFCIDRLP